MSKNKNTLIYLRELREEAMKKQLEHILPMIEAEAAKIDPKDIPEDFQELDPKLYRILKKYAYAKPPAHLKERVMKAVFADNYKPKTNNANSSNSYWNPFLVQSLRPLMYSFAGVFLIVLATIAYYQYTKPQSTQTDKIAGQETPIIKVSPNPTITPTISVATPSPVEIVNTNITKNKNNNNTKQDKKNKQSVTKSNSNQNNSKLADRASEEKLATNSTNNKNNISIKEASSDTRSEERSATLIGLRKIYISGFIEIELKDELEKAIKLSGRFMLTSQLEADATLQWSLSQPDTIILSTTTSPIVWKALVDKSRSLQEQAESIIFSLVQTIDIEKEKLEKNEQ